MKKIDCKFIFNSFFNYSKKKYLIYFNYFRNLVTFLYKNYVKFKI